MCASIIISEIKKKKENGPAERSASLYVTVWWRCSRSARSIDLIDSGKEKREKWKKKKKTFNVAGHARAHDADVARRPDETQSREYVDLDVSGHAGGAGSGSGGRGGGVALLLIRLFLSCWAAALSSCVVYKVVNANSIMR